MNSKLTIRDIALIGAMTAVITVSKEALAAIPGVELVSFWIIMFSIAFGWRVLFVVPVFVLIEGMIYGMGIWWIMYLYIWPMLAIYAFLNKRNESKWFWVISSGIFGLIFGFLCAFPYFVMGITDKGIRGGLYAGFTWWVAGIPHDIVHCIGNMVVMAVLYTPLKKIMKKIQTIYIP